MLALDGEDLLGNTIRVQAATPKPSRHSGAKHGKMGGERPLGALDMAGIALSVDARHKKLVQEQVGWFLDEKEIFFKWGEQQCWDIRPGIVGNGCALKHYDFDHIGCLCHEHLCAFFLMLPHISISNLLPPLPQLIVLLD